jgi:hypothetical protein
MDRTPSKSLAALWMAGWLALMLIVVVAGREGMRELNGGGGGPNPGAFIGGVVGGMLR